MVMVLFGFLLKSYKDDFESVVKLIDSYNLNNYENLPLDIVVPRFDLPLFSTFTSNTISVFIEEDIPVIFANEARSGIRPGYINQELVKLSYFRTERFENYLCLDSDALFLRPFGMNDFFTLQGEPFMVLVEDRELQSTPLYRQEHWLARQNKLDDIKEYLGADRSTELLTCHGFQIFQSSILRDFENKLLQEQEIDFIDLLTISPYEFSWYNYFVQLGNYNINVREPYFRVIHTGHQFAIEKMIGWKIDDWKHGYVGLVLNSNFQKVNFGKGYDTNPLLVSATYLKSRELIRFASVSLSALALRLLSWLPIQFLRLYRRSRESSQK
jgi:hypothetical protein